jgi:SPP1 gp7 family putative phage head morphogenesis protein
MKTDDKYLLEPVPHEEAMAFIKNKPVVSREVFDKFLPELKARAFTISGVESANTWQKVRDRIAELPAGANWDDIKKDIVNDISPWLVDDSAEAEVKDAQIAAANRRAELLLRTHGFQAYQATQHEVMQRQKDVFPYWQYMTMEDEAVRDSHAALDGLILPADSPFWADHYPPWDWGCRCQVVSITEEEQQAVAEDKSDYGFILSDAQTQLLENGGMLDTGDAHPVIVASPTAMGKDGAFSWDPGSLRIPMDELEGRYAPEVWKTFQTWAEKQPLDDSGVTIMDWLKGATLEAGKTGGKATDTAGGLDYLSKLARSRIETTETDMSTLQHERAVIFDANGKKLHVENGDTHRVNMDPRQARLGSGGVVSHSHPSGGAFSLKDLEFAFSYRLKELRAVTPNGVYSITAQGDKFNAKEFDNVKKAWKRLAEKASSPAEVDKALQKIAEENGFIYGFKEVSHD